MTETQSIADRFQTIFGSQPSIYRAPGRVNIIGEHTDYNEGFVMPAAIEFATWAAVSPRADRKIVVHSTNFTEQWEFSLEEGTASPRKHWTDYVQGVALTLVAAGKEISGANLLLHGEIPMGSGLSSSASMEVATGFALLSLAGVTPDRLELAKLCQAAENNFVGARCGIMDQFISGLGKAGFCLKIDCRSLQFEELPILPGVSMVVCNTMVKHSHANGEYNLRRQQCEEGVRLLEKSISGIGSLRDVSLADFERYEKELPPVIAQRCRHVISEIQRVEDAAIALRQSDLLHLGKLMQKSHFSLRDDFEVSCPELDIMVEAALRQEGVYGARMTGGGFGGCTINLVQSEFVEAFKDAVEWCYQDCTGIAPETYVSLPSDGVKQVL